MIKNFKKYLEIAVFVIVLTACSSVDAAKVTGMSGVAAETEAMSDTGQSETQAETKKEAVEETYKPDTADTAESETKPGTTEAETSESSVGTGREAKESRTEIGLDPGWEYASFSKINSGVSVLYRASDNAKGITVAVNAGHGTKGGSSVKTLCHPDGTPKVTSGTTKAGATAATAISEGMTFADGTPESTVTYEMAKVLKDKLLGRGYDVLMIRDGSDVQLDNIARTVIANNNASIHLALHWDSTESDKGAFYMGVPDVPSYRSMEPVAAMWKEHEALGKALIDGLLSNDIKIFGEGRMAMDLTQTSYSTIPSIDIELGDKVSGHGNESLEKLAAGLCDGIDIYFGK